MDIYRFIHSDGLYGSTIMFSSTGIVKVQILMDILKIQITKNIGGINNSRY